MRDRVLTGHCGTTGKIAYQSASDASRAKVGIIERLPRRAKGLNVYRCSACGRFHLGRRRKRRPLLPRVERVEQGEAVRV